LLRDKTKMQVAPPRSCTSIATPQDRGGPSP
jgi:hypothetical protein